MTAARASWSSRPAWSGPSTRRTTRGTGRCWSGWTASSRCWSGSCRPLSGSLPSAVLPGVLPGRGDRAHTGLVNRRCIQVVREYAQRGRSSTLDLIGLDVAGDSHALAELAAVILLGRCQRTGEHPEIVLDDIERQAGRAPGRSKG